MDSRVWREIGLWVVLPSAVISVVQLVLDQSVGSVLWILWLLALFFSPLKDRIPRSARLTIENYLFTRVGLTVILIVGMSLWMLLAQIF